MSGKPVGGTIEPCPVGQLKDLVVFDSEKGGSRHYDRKNALLEIVQTDSSDAVTIHYKGPNPPNPLGLTRDGQQMSSIPGRSRAGGLEFSLNTQYFPEDDPYKSAVETASFLLKGLFTFTSKTTVYILRDLPRSVQIKAYNPDQWKFSFSLPPFKQLKMGAQYNNSESAEVHKSDRLYAVDEKVDKELKLTQKTSSWKETTSQEVNAKYSSYCAAIATPTIYAYASTKRLSIDSKTEPKKVDSGRLAKGVPAGTLALERNSATVDLDLMDMVSSIISLVASVTEAIKKFRDYAPKIGWYIDVDIKVLEGAVELVWGWREGEDHQAYYYLGIAATVKLFSLTLEVGFGVSIGPVGGQVCVQLVGSISMRAGIERVKPGAESMSLGSVSGTLEAGGYIRVSAGDLMTIEGGIKSSFTMEVKIEVSLAEGFGLNGQPRWDGVTALVKAKTAFGWSRSKTSKWLDEQKFADWKYPEKKEDKRKEIRSEIEISKRVESVLTKGWSLRVFQKERVTRYVPLTDIEWTAFEDVQMEHSEVADIIAAAIWRHRAELLLDEQTIHGLAHAVRKKCDILAEKKWERDWMTEPELQDYLNSHEFARIIEAAVDPAKEYASRLAKDKT